MEPKKRTLQEHREHMAETEVGHTAVPAPVAAGLALAFLLTILSVPVAQHLHDFRHRPAEAGTRLPQAYEIVRVLPSRAEIRAALADPGPRSWLRLVPDAGKIRAFESTLEGRSVLRAWALPQVQLVLTAGLGVGNEQAYVGRDGWLFYRPCIEYLTAPGFLEVERFAPEKRDRRSPRDASRDPLAGILDFRDRLRARGIDLVVLPAPAKAMIHPEAFAGPPASRPLQNPSYRELAEALSRNGVTLFDPAELVFRRKAESGEAQYLATDSHWTPAAMEAVARGLADVVRPRLSPPLPGDTDVPFVRESRDVENLGDIAAMLRLDPPERVFARERVTLHPVRASDGSPWRPSRDAEVLLLGDSYTNIYSLASLGWGEGSGLAEQLSAELGRPVDRIAINNGGAIGTRQALDRELREGTDRLAGKRVVVWEFAIRELLGGDWRPVELPLPAAPAATGSTTPAVEAASVVEATVVAHGGAPEPGSVPYRDCLTALHLKSLVTREGPPVPPEALAYVWAMRENVWTEGATVKVGSVVRLKLLPWSAGEAALGSYNRKELPDDRLLELKAYWGELVR